MIALIGMMILLGIALGGVGLILNSRIGEWRKE